MISGTTYMIMIGTRWNSIFFKVIFPKNGLALTHLCRPVRSTFAVQETQYLGIKGGTRGSPIMPRDAVSRTANVERTGRHKWVKLDMSSRKIDIALCLAAALPGQENEFVLTTFGRFPFCSREVNFFW